MTPTSPSEPGGYPEAFVEAVRQAAAVVGWQFRSEDADGLEFVDRNGVRQSIGMKKFFRRFSDHNPAEWPTRVAEYLRTVIALTKGQVNDDLNAQAERVLVRLSQPYPRAPGLSVWSRPFPETGLAVMLVIEEGEGLRFVREDMVAASGCSGEEWYERGLENLRRRTPPGSLRVMEPESGLMGCCVGDAHDGSRALLLESLLPEPAPDGVLASVPRRDALLALPLNRKAMEQRSLALLKVFTQNQHAEASHPISPDIFWVRNGIWHRLGVGGRGRWGPLATPRSVGRRATSASGRGVRADRAEQTLQQSATPVLAFRMVHCLSARPPLLSESFGGEIT
jgi:hypothetical protein